MVFVLSNILFCLYCCCSYYAELTCWRSVSWKKCLVEAVQRPTVTSVNSQRNLFMLEELLFISFSCLSITLYIYINSLDMMMVWFPHSNTQQPTQIYIPHKIHLYYYNSNFSLSLLNKLSKLSCDCSNSTFIQDFNLQLKKKIIERERGREKIDMEVYDEAFIPAE